MINQKITAALCGAVMAVSGCADKADKVKGSYVSPMVYGDYSCRQLAAEASRLSSRASEAAGVQDQKAQGDAVATGVSLILFWPALFFIQGDGETKQELTRLKGEMDAVEAASIQKKCGLEFRKG